MLGLLSLFMAIGRLVLNFGTKPLALPLFLHLPRGARNVPVIDALTVAFAYSQPASILVGCWEFQNIYPTHLICVRSVRRLALATLNAFHLPLQRRTRGLTKRCLMTADAPT